jgi:hypothetical protein
MDEVVYIAPWVVEEIKRHVDNKLTGEMTIVWSDGGIRSIKNHSVKFPPKHNHTDAISYQGDQGVINE